MFVNQLALVSESNTVPFGQVAQISAALQKQISRDFGPIWGIEATISAFQELHDVPSGYWPIIIRDDINNPGASGFHTDDDGQPFSLVLSTEETSLACSHEMLEMLADPYGKRLIAGDSLKPGQGRVLYLVEVCDPSQDIHFAYRVNGILVSDFYTPNFFDPIGIAGTRYSFTGAINKPLEVREGGYISWKIPETGEMWQLHNFDGKPNYTKIEGRPKVGQSLRGFIDSQMHATHQAPARRPALKSMTDAAHLFAAASVREASQGWSDRLRANIDRVISEE